MDGHVSFQHPNEVDWTAASVNMALQPGDRIYSGEDGRAEIEIDDGSVLHLSEKTDIEILSLRDDLIQMRALASPHQLRLVLAARRFVWLPFLVTRTRKVLPRPVMGFLVPAGPRGLLQRQQLLSPQDLQLLPPQPPDDAVSRT